MSACIYRYHSTTFIEFVDFHHTFPGTIPLGYVERRRDKLSNSSSNKVTFKLLKVTFKYINKKLTVYANTFLGYMLNIL